MVEGIVTVAERVAEELPAVQPRIVLARHVANERRAQAPGDLLELAHAVGMLARILGVVRQIAGEENELRLARQAIDQFDRPLERLSAVGVGWSREAHMS